jgi:cobalt-zinc-cadmium efflux system outer membrane protein
MTKAIFGTLIACFLAGCGSTNPDPAFREVAGNIQGKIGKRVQWSRNTAQDAEADQYVQALLQRPLTTDSAVQVALLNNHELQATFENLGIAQADLVEAGLLRNPVFSVERRFPGRALETDVLAEFIDLLFLPLRKRIAAAELEAVKLRVAHEVLNTAADVRAAFYEHQGNEQLVDLGRSIESAAGAATEAALRLHEAGNTRDLDLANEQAQQVQAKLDLAKAQSQAIETREMLSKLMGVWGEQTKWTVAPRLPDPGGKEVSLSGLETRAIAQRADLAADKYELLAQAHKLGLARYEAMMQQAEAGAHYEREKSGEYSVGPSLQISIPIFNLGQAASARAQARFRQAEQRYLALAVQIRSEVRAARDRMLLARERAQYYQSTALPLRRRIVEETQLQYNAMQIGLFDLLQAKQEEVNQAREYVEALRDYWSARAQLEKAVGGSLSGKIFSLGKNPVGD